MKCIFCSTEDTVRFNSVEHVVPQSFGTFGPNTPTLDCVCDDCNAEFGRELDQVLARDTLEGISRYARGRYSSERRLQKRLDITLADGPETGEFGGMKVFVDGTTGNLLPPRAQFHVFNFETEKNEVYFLEQIPALVLPEAIYGRPAANGQPGTWRSKVFAASREEHDALVAALNAAGIAFVPGEPLKKPEEADLPQEGGTLPVDIQGTLDTLHKRALAKIFLNFVAWTLGCHEANKEKWDFLRNHVRHARGLIAARITSKPFWNGQETDDRRFIDDSIDIRIENRDGNIVGAIQFYGRGAYELILVEGDSLGPSQEIGYRFTPGQVPIRGERRPVGPNADEASA